MLALFVPVTLQFLHTENQILIACNTPKIQFCTLYFSVQIAYLISIWNLHSGERCENMATIISSLGLKGIEGYRVQVEVQLLPGIEGVGIVGLPDASVKESKDRVVAAKMIFHFQPTTKTSNMCLDTN